MALGRNLEAASLSVATLAVLEVASAVLEVAMALLEAENAPLAMAPLENNPPQEVAIAENAPLAMVPLENNPPQEAMAFHYAPLESESPRSYPVIQASD